MILPVIGSSKQRFLDIEELDKKRKTFFMSSNSSFKHIIIIDCLIK